MSDPTNVSELARETIENLPEAFHLGQWEIDELEKAFQSALSKLAADKEAEHDIELRRWQDRIYHLCCALAPTKNIDGAGCDSGDPLDLTATEIQQMASAFQDDLARHVAALKVAREEIANAPHEYMCGILVRVGQAKCECWKSTALQRIDKELKP